tara:strand:- start:2128 stop:2412 length:285 start_codon:yes stop_codon:yes gene_type:complete
MYSEQDLNKISIISFIITFIISLGLLYSFKPTWVLKIKENKIKIHYPLLVLYSFLFGSTISIFIILYFSKIKYDTNKPQDKKQEFSFPVDKIYA